MGVVLCTRRMDTFSNPLVSLHFRGSICYVFYDVSVHTIQLHFTVTLRTHFQPHLKRRSLHTQLVHQQLINPSNQTSTPWPASSVKRRSAPTTTRRRTPSRRRRRSSTTARYAELIADVIPLVGPLHVRPLSSYVACEQPYPILYRVPFPRGY